MKSVKNNLEKTLRIVLLGIFMFASFNLFAADETTDLLNIKISLDSEDASVSHIVSTMAKLSGCNIVLALEKADEDKGKIEEKMITIHLKDVPIEQAPLQRQEFW